jgi:hypothetical protein
VSLSVVAARNRSGSALRSAKLRRLRSFLRRGTSPYLLPYARVELLLHTILTTRWDAVTGPLARRQLPRVLDLRDQAAKGGWWN